MVFSNLANKNIVWRKYFWTWTYSSRSWVGHFACKLCPLILRPLFMQEISLESSNNILHSVNTHCWTIQNITEDTQKKEGKRSVIYHSPTQIIFLTVVIPTCMNKNISWTCLLWFHLSSRLNKKVMYCIKSCESLWLFSLNAPIYWMCSNPKSSLDECAAFSTSVCTTTHPIHCT